MDSVPIVCLTGQVPSHLIGTDAFQEGDTSGITPVPNVIIWSSKVPIYNAPKKPFMWRVPAGQACGH